MFFDSTIPDIVARGLILASVALLYVTGLVRIVGLRSFSKMTAFDFVMTVATGSLLAGASQAKDWAGFAQALIAMAGLFAAQYGIARARERSDRVEETLGNEPVLLMRDGEFIEDALDFTRVSKSDIVAKLREANVMHMHEVRAVVLETTGDVSVMHGDDLAPEVMLDVQEIRNGKKVQLLKP